MKVRYYKHFIDFWLPIYKRQVFKAKFNNEIEAIIEIKDNVMKNIHLTDNEKRYILKELDLMDIKEDRC